MNCDCGFKFSGAGEFRNHNTFLTKENKWIIVCPKCKAQYSNWTEGKEKMKTYSKTEILEAFPFLSYKAYELGWEKLESKWTEGKQMKKKGFCEKCNKQVEYNSRLNFKNFPYIKAYSCTICNTIFYY